MAKEKINLQFVKRHWSDEEAAKLSGLDRLVYRSNKLGADPALTNTGGGNTSSKLTEKDPLTGQSAEVLWIKGSGGDLGTSRRESFASLYLDKVRAMKAQYLSAPGRGPKTEPEDRMYPLYSHCVFNLNPRACSIDTPLHTFVPYRHVDHLHPNAVIAIAASVHQERLCREIYGDDLIYVPWQRPGFDIGLRIESLIERNSQAKGVLLGHHGMSSWSNDDRACYDTALEIVDRAACFIAERDRGPRTFGGQKYQPLAERRRRQTLVDIVPFLRGRLSGARRVVATIQDDERMLRFVNSVDAPRLSAIGTSCPDHFLRTKIKPLFVDWNPETGSVESLEELLLEGLSRYRADYEAYYRRHKRPDSPPMRDASPTVVLIPGLGMIGWGKNKGESRMTAEFYNGAVEVMRGAEAIDEYEAMDPQEAFDIEYWSLEEAKLRRLPPEKELERQVIAVVGAGSGIGKATARRLADEGAHVVSVDADRNSARETADEIAARRGPAPGLAGNGISDCGAAVGLDCDITNRSAVAQMLGDAVLAYGGLDALVVTAGVFVPPDENGRIDDGAWARTFAVNVTGVHIAVDEAANILRRQRLPAAVVIATSANAVVAKKGSLAYDASKAALNHLVRELAVELAPLTRVNAVAPATVLKGSTMFSRQRVAASLAKYGISFSAEDSDDALRARLAAFYATRSLLQTPIEPEDLAEAIFLLVSPPRLPKTTGHIITVDGGLQDGFLR
ncbi:MAG TPA: bifunctional rhamnulose-1-phosphate aldolase/short-chain dehydrogenase [Terriglobia bacterium]|nr:bifunctional rhamnulose-1-phosphate aldolase/short-chain dehydrogenase [Terriglobia bacterium]